MSNHKIVITGLGVMSPNGCNLAEFWDNISNARSGIGRYVWPEAYGFKSEVVGRIRSKEPIVLDQKIPTRYARLALAATRRALDDAGLMLNEQQRARAGVSVATAIGGAAEMEKNFISMTKGGMREIDPDCVPKESYNGLDFSLASRCIAHQYGVCGPVSTYTTGCTAGLDAIGAGLHALRWDDALDIMIVGASEAPLCPLSVGAFEALGALSTRKCEDISQASCPYDGRRDGFVIAEGAGIIILETLAHAQERGAKIYAELAGYASVNNAFHMTDLPSDGEGLANCITHTLQDAQCKPSELDLIDAHGSSTVQNDLHETNAVKSILKDCVGHIQMNSLKSMLGHALSAANAIEVVALCLEMKHQQLYPTINLQSPGEGCDLDYVAQKGRRKKIKHALKLSSGFSGIHSGAILRSL